MEKFTWQQLLDKALQKGGDFQLFSNIIGHMMDDEESWEWDAVAPGYAINRILHG